MPGASGCTRVQSEGAVVGIFRGTAPAGICGSEGLVMMAHTKRATRPKPNGNGHSKAGAKHPRYAPGQHGALPLSQRTQRRLLSELLHRADRGDVAAAEALVRLGMQHELRSAMPRIRLVEA